MSETSGYYSTISLLSVNFVIFRISCSKISFEYRIFPLVDCLLWSMGSWRIKCGQVGLALLTLFLHALLVAQICLLNSSALMFITTTASQVLDWTIQHLLGQIIERVVAHFPWSTRHRELLYLVTSPITAFILLRSTFVDQICLLIHPLRLIGTGSTCFVFGCWEGREFLRKGNQTSRGWLESVRILRASSLGKLLVQHVIPICVVYTLRLARRHRISHHVICFGFRDILHRLLSRICQNWLNLDR